MCFSESLFNEYDALVYGKLIYLSVISGIFLIGQMIMNYKKEL